MKNTKEPTLIMDFEGLFRFIWADRHHSRNFSSARPFSEGIATVKTMKEDYYRFMNLDEKLSKDRYFYASSYKNGFSIVQVEKDTPFFLRDKKGKLSGCGWMTRELAEKARNQSVEDAFELQ